MVGFPGLSKASPYFSPNYPMSGPVQNLQGSLRPVSQEDSFEGPKKGFVGRTYDKVKNFAKNKWTLALLTVGIGYMLLRKKTKGVFTSITNLFSKDKPNSNTSTGKPAE